MTPTAKLEIRFNNLNLAQEGDSVSVAGFYQPPDETTIKGDRVTITTDRIFGEPVEPTKRVSRRRRRGEETATGGKGTGDGGKNAKNQSAEGATVRGDEDTSVKAETQEGET